MNGLRTGSFQIWKAIPRPAEIIALVNKFAISMRPTQARVYFGNVSAAPGILEVFII